MNKKDLEALGITDEAIAEKIIVLHGKDIEKIKADGATAVAEAVTLKTQLEEANKAIKGFEDMKPAELKLAVENYKTAAETAKVEAEKQVAAIRFDTKLDKQLEELGVKDVVSMRAHLKTGDLKLGEDGVIIGLKEQLDPKRTTHEHLFVPAPTDQKPQPRIVAGAEGKTSVTVGEAFRTNLRIGAGVSPTQTEGK